jgi:hypothetical protein
MIILKSVLGEGVGRWRRQREKSMEDREREAEELPLDLKGSRKLLTGLILVTTHKAIRGSRIQMQRCQLSGSCKNSLMTRARPGNKIGPERQRQV